MERLGVFWSDADGPAYRPDKEVSVTVMKTLVGILPFLRVT